MNTTKIGKIDWYDPSTGDGVISVGGKAYASFYIEQAYNDQNSCKVLNKCRTPKAGDSVLAEIYNNGDRRIVLTMLLGDYYQLDDNPISGVLTL